MQVNPDTATIVCVATPRGGELTLDPGREVVARVVAADGSGNARINLAGQTFEVRTDAPLQVGDEVRLSVSRADATGVRLAIVTPEGSAAARSPSTAASVSTLIQELARAGVPVTPQLTSAVNQIVAQLSGNSEAARAVAQLAARSLALSPEAAGRIVAALELAGNLGSALTSLAARSSEVAAALPNGTPSAGSLRALLTPGLNHAELAIARIVQSAQAASATPTITVSAPVSSNPTVIQSYVTSQLSITANLDQLANQNTTIGTATLLEMRGLNASSGSQFGSSATAQGFTASALQAAIRGQAASSPAGLASLPSPASNLSMLPIGSNISQAAFASIPAQVNAQATGAARANANAAAATGAASSMPTPTGSAMAGAIADLATLATRFASAVAPGTGSVGATGEAAARGMNASEVAQRIGPAGNAGAANASVAGKGVSGDPLPLVTALRAFLSSPQTETDAARLMGSLRTSSAASLTVAISTLSESQALQLAGKLLDILPSTGQLSSSSQHALRAGVHSALDRLGAALVPSDSSETSILRAALELVATSDARPGVANDAARLLAALDGQQILSRTSSGADPGYVYFQVPMPDGRGAEVLVRREPGRRQVSFDEFRIAFLLSTEHLGTLMIELDAHPAGVRADVRTDVPELEPFIRSYSDQLIEPLTREARRPVMVTTGVFEQEPPTSLLAPQLGMLEPGKHEFYA